MTSNDEQARQIKKLRKKRWTFFFGAAGVISAIVAVTTFWRSLSDPSPTLPNVIGGSCAQVGNNNKCTVQQQAAEHFRGTDDRQEFKHRVAEISQAPPQGTGPWPYLVWDTFNDLAQQEFGLKIKMAPSLEGAQVGSAAPGSFLWADCQVENSVDPGKGTPDDVGAKWLRIHWPTADAGSTKYNLSSPSAPFLEYAYAGYALPYGHNGKIPKCL